MTELLNLKTKTYSPIFDKFNINYVSPIHKYTKSIDYNHYEYEDLSGNINNCFIKYIPLIDYVKLLTGKYKKFDVYKLPENDKEPENLYEEYIHSINNYSYVDSFFYLLSSKLKDYGFIHSLDVYDSKIELKDNFEIDITDDYEYICESKFFSENIGNMFYFKNEKIQKLVSNTKDPIKITDEKIELSYETIDLDYEIDILKNNIETNDISDLQCVENCVVDESDVESDEESDEESDDESEEDESEEDENDDESDEESLDIGSVSIDDDIEELKIVINKLPCQTIALEKCNDTLDSLFENDIRVEELTSAIFQIIIMLDVYQKMFDLTHNDLHTNNIMFIETNEEFLNYKINNKYYKVPTFGRIFKIIDFGRSIYKYNEQRLCSDSFSSNGTAYGQYNCEPFYNQNKHKIDPNPSFDLCRLACSIFDFIVDDYKEVNIYRNIPVYNMIIQWLYDDENKNILYKENGKERYPDFKLYKMIAKTVHNHIPAKQYDNECFNPYRVETLENFMDLDELIKKKVHL